MRYLNFTFLLCFVSGWLYAQDSVTLRMDPDNTLGGSVSQIFDTVEYIPLETNKESLFGLADQLIVTDSLYFILDRTTDQILLFHKNGKYYSKVQMQRYVKAESSQGIRNFMVDVYNRRIIINHFTNQGVLYFFNFQGKLIKKETPIHWENFAPLGSDHYLMSSSGNITDSVSGKIGNCIIVDSSLKRYDKFVLRALPNVWTGFGTYTHTIPGSDHCIYSRSYDYTAYEIGLQGILKKYKFIFPLTYTLPSNFLDSSLIRNQANYIRREKPQTIQGIDNLLFSGDFLSFVLRSSGGANSISPYIFSAKSQNIYSMWNVTTDSAHYFLPCFYIYGKLHGSDEKYFYSFIPVNNFKSAYEENLKERKVIYPDRIKKLFNSLKTYDNPILVRLKPKSGI